MKIWVVPSALALPPEIESVVPPLFLSVGSADEIHKTIRLHPAIGTL